MSQAQKTNFLLVVTGITALVVLYLMYENIDQKKIAKARYEQLLAK